MPIDSGVKRALSKLKAVGRSRDQAAPWVADGGLRRRHYRSEAEYVDHQRSKLSAKSACVRRADDTLAKVLPSRLPDVAGLSVLCLAARLGGEVRVFRAAGAFALGLDLNPGPDNAWVLPGDFHALDFPEDCVDVVYSNSLDHALDLPTVVEEVRRVLKPGGLAVMEFGLGTNEGGSFGRWEATMWEHIEDLVAIFEQAGFVREAGLDFSEPWAGRQVRLRA